MVFAIGWNDQSQTRDCLAALAGQERVGGRPVASPANRCFSVGGPGRRGLLEPIVDLSSMSAT